MTALVLAEHAEGHVADATLAAVTAAVQLGGGVHILVAGDGAEAQSAADAAAKIAGVEKVLLASDPAYAHGLAENVAPLIVGLMAGMIGFPFVVASLDALMLSFVSMALLLVGASAMTRAGAVHPRAALMMAPGMVWLGFSALIGLSFAAAWSPPFAVTNSQGAA